MDAEYAFVSRTREGAAGIAMSDSYGMRVSITFDLDNCDTRAEAENRLDLLGIQSRSDSGVHLVKVSYIKYKETTVDLGGQNG